MDLSRINRGETMTAAEVQSLLLKVLAAGADARLGRGQYYLAKSVIAASPQDPPTPRQIMEGVWSLVGQGLAYIDYSESAAENWMLHLTEAGLAAASDEEINPNDPARYLERLMVEIPNLGPIVQDYVEEALSAYNARLYRASAVMLGVASEAAVLEVAAALTSVMEEAEAKKYHETINARKLNFGVKFDTFAQKLRSKKNLLPKDFAGGLELTVNSVTDLLRVSRNDAGHPTGKRIGRADCFIHLQMFVRYAAKLYSLKNSLQNHP
jgi:hypothetical protein